MTPDFDTKALSIGSGRKSKGGRAMRHSISALMIIAVMGYAFQAKAVDKYVVDPDHTNVGFSVTHMLITNVEGEFNRFEGTIMFDENDLSKTSVTGTIDVAGIDTDNERRDGHLKSEDFFHAEKYPKITFESKKVVKREDGYVMIGDMTIRGVTKEVKVPFEFVGKVNDMQGVPRIGLKARAVINRRDFGVSWNRALEAGGLVVGDEVEIDLDVQAIKAQG